jgi:hypothetical protein
MHTLALDLIGVLALSIVLLALVAYGVAFFWLASLWRDARHSITVLDARLSVIVAALAGAGTAGTVLVALGWRWLVLAVMLAPLAFLVVGSATANALRGTGAGSHGNVAAPRLQRH